MKSTPFTVGLLALALHAQAQEPIKDRSRVPATAHSEGSVEEGTLRALAHITKRIQILFDRTLRLIDRFPTMPSVDRKSLTGVIDELAGMLRENASALRRGDITSKQLNSQASRLESLEGLVAEVSARLETKASPTSKGGQS